MITRTTPVSWPRPRSFAASLLLGCVALVLAGCGGGGGDAGSAPVIPGPPVDGPAWWGFARDPQHAAQSAIATQDLNRIAWSTSLDLAPQRGAGGALLIHYGSPVVTSHNTVVVPVKTGAGGGFRFEARSGDQRRPDLVGGQRLRAAGAQLGAELQPRAQRREPALRAGRGRQAADQGGCRRGQRHASSTIVFYGAAAYAANAGRLRRQRLHQHADHGRRRRATSSSASSSPARNPAGLDSGIARIGANGVGSWVVGRGRGRRRRRSPRSR